MDKTGELGSTHRKWCISMLGILTTQSRFAWKAIDIDAVQLSPYFRGLVACCLSTGDYPQGCSEVPHCTFMHMVNFRPCKVSPCYFQLEVSVVRFL